MLNIGFPHLVFVLDVNHDYGPWLIERDRLFAAQDTLDGKKKRGMLRYGRCSLSRAYSCSMSPPPRSTPPVANVWRACSKRG
jgi:hypothetical protein